MLFVLCPKTYYMSIDIPKSRPAVRRKQGVFDWESVGRRIRELRGFQMTQKEFAKRIGVSQGHFSYIERGEKEIGAEILLRISREFGKSIEWLLTGED
jgi:DNA-binding XRE family transcriptional regulator